MDSQFTLSLQLEAILLELIDREIWATRERLGYRRAIHSLDHESQYLKPQHYSTNLDMRFDVLVSQHQDVLNRIADYLATEVLPGLTGLKVVAPAAFGAKKYTIGAMTYLTRRLGLDMIDGDQLRTHNQLLLLAGSHSQELVNFWRQHDNQIALVVTLLGTSHKHIEQDLQLSTGKYHALACGDTLSQIDPERRKYMIPGVGKSTIDRNTTPASLPPAPLALIPPALPSNGMRTQLQELANWVSTITYPGEFLLSVNKFSDSWLYIVDFNKARVRELSADLLTHVLARYLDQHAEPYVLFCSEMGPLSEDEFATLEVANMAMERLNDYPLSFERFWEPEHGVVVLDSEGFAGKRGIGFFVLSIHVDFLLDTIAKIREAGGDVAALITIIERDNVGRDAFAAQGVDLIPFILWDADNKELKSVLERTEATYMPYHALFA